MKTVVDGLITINSKGIVQSFTPSAERIFGYSAAEVVGNNVSMLMPAPYTENHDRYVADYLRTGTAKIIGIGRETTGRRKNGETFPVDLAVNKTMVGGEMLFVGIVRDITVRKKAERILSEANSRLSEAGVVQQKLIRKLTETNTELERFAYVASHDMQEPLRMISNFSQLLISEYGDRLENEGKEYLNIVITSVARMQNFVSDLLQYARVGSGAVQNKRMNANAETLLAIHSLQQMIKEKNAIVTLGPLPEIVGNVVQFSSLLQNLISNGLKYQEKGKSPALHVGASDGEEGYYTFSMRDNGIGMDEKSFKEIFDPFVRLHAQEEYPGTGIGLALCRRIVENHGGRIWVASQPGLGSTFYFSWPKPTEEKS